MQRLYLTSFPKFNKTLFSKKHVRDAKIFKIISVNHAIEQARWSSYN